MTDDLSEKAGSETPSGFVARCRCGKTFGAMGYARTNRRDAGRILGEWLHRATDGKWYAAVVLYDYSIRRTVIHHWAVCQEYEWNPTHWMPLPDPPDTTETPE